MVLIFDLEKNGSLFDPVRGLLTCEGGRRVLLQSASNYCVLSDYRACTVLLTPITLPVFEYVGSVSVNDINRKR